MRLSASFTVSLFIISHNLSYNRKRLGASRLIEQHSGQQQLHLCLQPACADSGSGGLVEMHLTSEHPEGPLRSIRVLPNINSPYHFSAGGSASKFSFSTTHPTIHLESRAQVAVCLGPQEPSISLLRQESTYGS